MIVKPKTACGDEDDLFSNLGPCSDFYVSKRVPTKVTQLGDLMQNRPTFCFQDRKRIRHKVPPYA